MQKSTKNAHIQTPQTEQHKIYLFVQSRTLIGGFPVYIGYKNEKGHLIDLTELSPARSQDVINHSPDGFNWGYGGSGPSQCALGILLDVTDDEDVALQWYQRFKEEVIAHIPTDKKIQMPETKIWEWLQQKDVNL